MEKLSQTAGFACPFCGSKRIRRSHRHAFAERFFLPFFRRHPFRCMDCYERFYSPESVDPRPHRLAAVLSEPPKVKPAQEPPGPKTNVPPSSAPEERRVFSRVACQIPARVVAGSGASITGVLTDISLSGCFVETRDPISVGNEIELSLETKEGPQSRALVRRSLQARGMGVEFTFMTAPNFRRLQHLAKNSVRLNVRP